MADRPIIFSTPMVRALIEGRKTQTRRILKPWPGTQSNWLTSKTLHSSPSCYLATVGGHLGVQMQHTQAGTCVNGLKVSPMSPLTWVRLPYAPGDQLYVREAFVTGFNIADETGQPVGDRKVWYRATDAGLAWYDADSEITLDNPPWKPSIHMPRWASRLTLTISDVRVQRLQDISAADSIAEGVECETCGAMAQSACHGKGCFASLAAFRTLWNSLHGPDAWDANPWVMALTFTVEQRNIDAGAR